MIRRYTQLGTQFVSYHDGVLIVEKLVFYRVFSWIAVAFFLCFPVAALAFVWPSASVLPHQRHEYLVSFALPGMCGACLFSLLGSALFLPVATSCRLTIDLRQKRWTLERSLWRWKEKVEGTTDDFGCVMWGSNSESGPMAWIVWNKKQRGGVALMVGDRPTLTARKLAQEVATALDLPLTDLKRRPLPQ